MKMKARHSRIRMSKRDARYGKQNSRDSAKTFSHYSVIPTLTIPFHTFTRYVHNIHRMRWLAYILRIRLSIYFREFYEYLF